MAQILHRIGIKASVSKVYEALSTIDGLSGWWTRETSGSSQVGGSIEFRFRNDDGSIKGAFVMEVKTLEPNKKVTWLVNSGPPDWVGTDINFSLAEEGDTTIVLFNHRNWEEATESMAHCSMKWATFMLSLRQHVETRNGLPAPDDVKIDNWN